MLPNIHCGNSLELLKQMKSETINCCITSPPYWSLRDYGTKPEIWDEDSTCEHNWQAHIRRPQGGRGSKGANVGANKNDVANLRDHNIETNFCSKCGAWKGSLGLEPTFDLYIKHLCNIFDEVKRVLKKDGTCWVVIGDTYASGGGKASEQSWIRNNGTTQDHPDNPSKSKLRGVMGKSLIMIPFRFAIEMVNRGWILRNTIIWWKPNCMPASVKDRFTVDFEYVFFFTKNKKYWFEQQLEPAINWGKRDRSKGKYKLAGLANGLENSTEERNKRTVWHQSTKPFKEAHFAVFPEDLIEPMIKAGCPEEGLVLDPFLGSGTTAVVAEKLKRYWLGIELNPEYCELATKRILNARKERK